MIEIEPDGTCSAPGTSAIQQALDALPAVPSEGYIFQLDAGVYCGDFVLENDYEEVNGEFEPTQLRNNIHFLGSTLGDTILSTSWVWSDVGDRVYAEVNGCPESSNYDSFTNAARTSTDPDHDKVIHCIQNPIKNIYFNNVIFDGNNVNPFLLTIKTARDIVMDNVTFRDVSNNDTYNAPASHHGPLWGHQTVTNVWCRNCSFDGVQEYATYFDGLHGGGFVYSRVSEGFTAGAFLLLTNDDLTLDRDKNGTVEQDEYGIAQYNVLYKNVLNGNYSSGFAITGRQNIVSENIVNGRASVFAYLTTKTNLTVQTDGATPTKVKYEYLGNRIKNNTVFETANFVRAEQSTDACSLANFNLGICATQGEHEIEGNVIFSSNQNTLIQELWTTTNSGQDRILPSSLQDNCFKGGMLMDGMSPASSGGPALTIDPNVPCSTEQPLGSEYTNAVANGSFENLTTGYPTSWWNRLGITSSDQEAVDGELSMRVEGVNSYVFQNLSPLLMPNTAYYLTLRVKAESLATPGSTSFYARLSENAPVITTTNAINFETDYWTSTGKRFVTGSAFVSNRLDIVYSMGASDTVFFDDIAIIPASEYDRSISLPAVNPSPTPTPSPTPENGTPNPTGQPGTPETHLQSRMSSRPPGCDVLKPGSVPDLFEIDVEGTTATLYFTPVSFENEKYFIAFGPNQSRFAHGVEFPFSETDGTVEYTVNHLQPGQTYYFAVRGGKGCMPGDWSNEIIVAIPTTQGETSPTVTKFYK